MAVCPKKERYERTKNVLSCLSFFDVMAMEMYSFYDFLFCYANIVIEIYLSGTFNHTKLYI